MQGDRKCVLVLGGGINGAAIARELLLSEVDVVLVDKRDLASGATAASSRLIHGGLRYLEYHELDLVRESLAERGRLLRLAPQFVLPLELFIPIENRFGGLVRSALRFLGLDRFERLVPSRPRGLELVELGLRMYDRLARDPALPAHRQCSIGQAGVPRVDPARFRWLCSYHDAQIRFPERFVLALVEDARRLAQESGRRFDVYTYHAARLFGRTAEIRPSGGEQIVAAFEPSAIINATGAWVDETLVDLHVVETPWMGGTKGSHILTANNRMHEALAGFGLYAEAADGRPVFMLPLGDMTLIGTTDLVYRGDPGDAVASADEIDYLLAAVARIFPEVGLSRSDVELHYSGVRPLPAARGKSPGAVTRRHWLQKHDQSTVPLYSVIGGKLTTCRSLAEQTAATVLAELQLAHTGNSRERAVPGGEDYPAGYAQLNARWKALAQQHGLSRESIRAMWTLVGSRLDAILAGLDPRADADDLLSGTWLPRAFARWSVENEHVRALSDLVERRLMLLYDPRLSERSLRQLAELLSEAGKISADAIEAEVERELARLRERYGRTVRVPQGSA